MDNIQNLLNQVAEIREIHAEKLDKSGGRFNIFKICGVNHYENTHSAIIAEFLNPKGTHGLKAKFLECFINMFCNNDLKQNFDYETASAKTEHHTGGDGRIDIFIEDKKNHAIIIENKIYADDGWEQLKKYDDFAKNDYGEGNYQIFYLTLWGVDASEQSAKGIKYKCISYNTNIIAWLEECVCICIAEGIPRVQETIIQYKNLIETLTNQDMDTKNKEEIMQLLCKSPDNMESVFAILDVLGYEFSDVAIHIVNNIFWHQFETICKKMNLKSEVFKGPILETSDFRGFIIRPPNWNFFEIRFEFKKGLKDFRRGFVIYRGEDEKSENDRLFKSMEIIRKKIKKNYPKAECYETWGVSYMFPEYVDWDNKEAMIAILNGEMAGIFEREIKKMLETTEGLKM